VKDRLQDVVADVISLDNATSTPDLPDCGVVFRLEVSLSSIFCLFFLKE